MNSGREAPKWSQGTLTIVRIDDDDIGDRTRVTFEARSRLQISIPRIDDESIPSVKRRAEAVYFEIMGLMFE